MRILTIGPSPLTLILVEVDNSSCCNDLPPLPRTTPKYSFWIGTSIAVYFEDVKSCFKLKYESIYYQSRHTVYCTLTKFVYEIF